MDFFVSHAGRDRVWAEWVAWYLVEAGYTVELDSWDWAAGENFVTKMRGALDAADRVVALLSPAYFEELRYTTEEWTSALVKDGDGGHRLMPVQVESCAVPRLLSPLLRVELFEVDEAEAVRRLIAAARGPARPDGKPGFPGHGRAGALTGRGEVGPRLPGVLPAVWNVGPRNPGFVGRETPRSWVSGSGCGRVGRPWCRLCTAWAGWARPRWRSSTRTATPGSMTWCGGSALRRPVCSVSSTRRWRSSLTWPHRAPTRPVRWGRCAPTCVAQPVAAAARQCRVTS